MRYFSIGFLLVAGFAGMGCGAGAGGSSTPSATIKANGVTLESDLVETVEFDDQAQATLTFDDVGNDDTYILGFYSYASGGATQAYQVGDVSVFASLSDYEGLNESDETEDFHATLRAAESELDPNAYIPDMKMHLSSSIAASSTAYTVGSTRSFKVLNSLSNSSSYTTITAECLQITDNFMVWMDSRDVSAGILTISDIEDILADYDRIIPTEEAMFGESSDVDDDGHFNVLLTRAVNLLGATGGGYITGYYYAVDQFSSGTYSQSNNTDIVYISVPDPTGDHGVTVSKSFYLSNIVKSVLVHEFQHMINFNMHFNVNGGSAESSWLNEGLSHLAEDIFSVDCEVDSDDSSCSHLNSDEPGYMQNTGKENFARMATYLNNIEDICFSCGSSLAQRGGSYLFLRYYYEQAEKGHADNAANGWEFVQHLLDTDQTSVTNVVLSYFGDDVDIQSTFRAMVAQAGLAYLVSDTDLSDDDVYELDGFNMRGAANDNRGTVLSGPKINLFSDTLTNTLGGTSLSFVEIDANDINDLGGSLTIEVGDNSTTGAFLIQTGY